ncbi:L-rhamnose isomerase [Spiroplasma chinense]|uniref:L-rhamnose isomerase n=1 Tax=Spiroplasma chinense TaxID=216932 RepID=A0A5B9Y5M5_9MOLU|nr:L-rhamnose isomerase [Spiroplasma chinense]QEH61999.1 L-rhamnose isomerase [Spiroplasma chinense]
MKEIIERYEYAKKVYAKLGIDTDKAIERIKKIPVSINCWQGDDVKGFIKNDQPISGGILVTGNYPGAARNAGELKQDLSKVLSLIPGNHKLNLHAIYVDTDEEIELNQIEPKHYKGWVEWAKKEGIGLDFNPTLFSHPMYKNGFTLSSSDENVRKFWIEHCKKSIEIAEFFAKELNQKCINNIWIPDGYKDFTVDKYGPRKRLKESLDEIFSKDYDKSLVLNTMESKLFGIGIEAYTVGSNEFYLSYAVSRNTGLCMDMGHFHPTEQCSNKVSTVLNFIDELLLHVTRPMRWDSDHVVSLDDETQEMMSEILRNNFDDRVHVALDFFDATINRVAAWVIGTRNVIKALLKASLEPTEILKKAELENDLTTRLALLEEQKNYPWVDVWNYYCYKENVPFDESWLDEVKKYEKEVLSERV